MGREWNEVCEGWGEMGMYLVRCMNATEWLLDVSLYVCMYYRFKWSIYDLSSGGRQEGREGGRVGEGRARGKGRQSISPPIPKRTSIQQENKFALTTREKQKRQAEFGTKPYSSDSPLSWL